MKLYSLELSGHAHRARLCASLIGVDVDIIPVDLLSGAHKQPEFLAKNPFGQVPVLEDGEVTLFDSNAILHYLANKYDDSGRWLPKDPAAAAEVQTWLAKAANEAAHGVAAARLITVFKAPLDKETVHAKAHHFLSVVDAHLVKRDWLVGESATIADIAQYSYIAHAPEGGIDLGPYANVREWLSRLEALPGFVAMTPTETPEKQALAS